MFRWSVVNQSKTTIRRLSKKVKTPLSLFLFLLGFHGNCYRALQMSARSTCESRECLISTHYIHPWLRGWAKLILLTVGWPWLSHVAPIKEGIVCCIRSVSWNIRPWMDLLDILSSPVTWVVTIVSLLYILYRYLNVESCWRPHPFSKLVF
jgi:hypothetical protein